MLIMSTFVTSYTTSLKKVQKRVGKQLLFTLHLVVLIVDFYEDILVYRRISTYDIHTIAIRLSLVNLL